MTTCRKQHQNLWLEMTDHKPKRVTEKKAEADFE